MAEPHVLFYTEAPHMDSLVFAPPDEAEFISSIHRALAAKTWGEFIKLMPPSELTELLERMAEWSYEAGEIDDEEEFQPPRDDTPFDVAASIPGFCDGDYPEWLQQSQDQFLPAEICRDFARCENSVINGPFWIIESANESEIVAALRAVGYHVERRDDLKFY